MVKSTGLVPPSEVQVNFSGLSLAAASTSFQTLQRVSPEVPLSTSGISTVMAMTPIYNNPGGEVLYSVL